MTKKIMDIAYAFQQSRALLTAFELGIFTAIGPRSRASEDIAKDIGANPRATDRLMNALVALGLLKKLKNRFSNTPEGLKCLVKGNKEYMSGLSHVANMWKTWSYLTDSVRKGSATGIDPNMHDRDPHWFDSFIAAMHYRAVKQAPHVLKALDLKKVKKVLDIGGGSGAYSIAFCQAKKDIEVVVFDIPKVISITKYYLEEAKVGNRVSAQAGDYNFDGLGRGYDLIFLSSIIHSNSPEENLMLIEKCADALNDGGQVVVQDFIVDDSRTKPAFGALFALNMLVGTRHGDTYTEAEVRKWMKQAGIKQIKRKDTSFGTQLIIGKM